MALVDNIVASWKMNEAHETSNLVDIVNGNTLTGFNDPEVREGVIGNGRRFNGRNGGGASNTYGQYFTAADSATLSLGATDFTIAGWFVWTGPQNQIAERGGSLTLAKQNLSSADNIEYQVSFGTSGTTFTVQFTVVDASLDALGRANHAYYMICEDGDYYREFTDTWHMFMVTFTNATKTLSVDLWQGNKTTGLPPTVREDLWPTGPFGRKLTGPGYGGQYGDASAFGGVFDGPGTLNLGVRKTNKTSPRDLFYDTNTVVDNVSIWKRALSLDEGVELWNQGNGLEYPFLKATGQKWDQPEDPIFLPTPSSLYEGASWSVGETPPPPPTPLCAWMTQPTLPVWRVPQRIRGWSFGNNFPLPDPVPLMSQWHLQSADPVRDDDVRRLKMIAATSPYGFPVGIVDVPVIPDPPEPPGDPSEPPGSPVADDIYRPGRADNDTTRYLDADEAD